MASPALPRRNHDHRDVMAFALDKSNHTASLPLAILLQRASAQIRLGNKESNNKVSNSAS